MRSERFSETGCDLSTAWREKWSMQKGWEWTLSAAAAAAAVGWEWWWGRRWKWSFNSPQVGRKYSGFIDQMKRKEENNIAYACTEILERVELSHSELWAGSDGEVTWRWPMWHVHFHLLHEGRMKVRWWNKSMRWCNKMLKCTNDLQMSVNQVKTASVYEETLQCIHCCVYISMYVYLLCPCTCLVFLLVFFLFFFSSSSSSSCVCCVSLFLCVCVSVCVRMWTHTQEKQQEKEESRGRGSCTGALENWWKRTKALLWAKYLHEYVHWWSIDQTVLVKAKCCGIPFTLALSSSLPHAAASNRQSEIEVSWHVEALRERCTLSRQARKERTFLHIEATASFYWEEERTFKSLHCTRVQV